ncbi:MAG: M48 family metallopeptidase [Proteobacteria bacterium]|nr:M48 family metallopeptidase [Pseudomonadota bacterium]
MAFWRSLLGGTLAPPDAAALPRPLPAPAADEGHRERQSVCGIAYRLERGRRKSIGLIVTVEGLLIRAPHWTPLYEIDAAIAERRGWIVEAMARQARRRAELAEHRDGGHVLYRGERLPVELRAGPIDRIELSDAHCVLTTAAGRFDGDAFAAELKRQAARELPPLAREMAAQAALPLATVSISSARTMWGSCTAQGRVRLNYRLLQLPPELMRHVVAHELAHLVEFNHSRRFWAIVERLDPASRLHRRAIQAYSVLLEL